MRNNTMKRAWEIRREVAKEMDVKVSKVSMSECLKMAWEEAKTTNVDYVSEVKNMTTKFDEVIDDLDERTVKTIYTMLTQFDGKAWVKNDKARIYINNAWDLVEHEKLKVYSSNIWLTNIVRGDWANWKINGIEIDDVIRHRKAHLLLCSQLEQNRIDLDFYYDVFSNTFYFHSVGFDIENTIIENIKENVNNL